MKPPKTIAATAITGQQGVNLVEQRVLEMGYLWHPTTGAVEAGIDGFIEIREPDTGRVTNHVLQAQVKSTARSWPGESDKGFHYVCNERDVAYWLGGTIPMILVVVRPSTGEVYWKALPAYLSDPVRRASRRVEFKKATDRLDVSAAPQLAHLGAPRGSSLFHLRSRPERLLTNLAPVTVNAARICRAPTKYATPELIHAALRDRELRLPRPWLLKGGFLYTFDEMDEGEWGVVADRAKKEFDDLASWRDADEGERQRDFVSLLHLTLKDQLWPRVEAYREKGRNHYAFRASRDLKAYKQRYRGRARQSGITVFVGYSPDDEGRPRYYRAHAFQGRFERFANGWYLEIVPTYRFTRDGRQPDRFAEDHMSGIKRMEGHQAVAAQVRMWADLLTAGPDLFNARRRPLLQFGPLLELPVETGIDDAAWTPRDTELADDNAGDGELGDDRAAADDEANDSDGVGDALQEPLFASRPGGK